MYHGIRPKEAIEKLDPELALTDRLIEVAYKLYYSSVNHSKLYEGWNLPRKPDRMIHTLAKLIRENRLRDLLVELSPSPKNDEYWFLIKQANSLENLSSLELKPIKLTKPLRPGRSYPCVDKIKFRLFLLRPLRIMIQFCLRSFFLLEVKDDKKRPYKVHGVPRRISL